MGVAVIVAVAENGVVGRNNALPWYLPEDLKFFKRTTLGKPIIMGRKTYDSIGKPLPGRTNIVVSANPRFAPEGVRVVPSLEEGLALGADVALIDGQEEVMVIGGSSIYAAAIPLADTLYVTEVHAKVDGDAFLPAVDWSRWREMAREQHAAVEPNPYSYSFVTYRRR